jgi:hypothetical protein
MSWRSRTKRLGIVPGCLCEHTSYVDTYVIDGHRDMCIHRNSWQGHRPATVIRFMVLAIDRSPVDHRIKLVVLSASDDRAITAHVTEEYLARAVRPVR